MEQKKNEQKTTQILYITMMLVLLVMALAVGLVTAANRRKAPATTTDLSAMSTDTVKTTALPDKDHVSPSVTTARTTESTTARTTATTTAPAVTTTPATSDRAAVNVEPVSVLPEFIMPTIGDVAKTFSVDALVFSNTMEDYRTHNGIDICGAVGEGVMAAADGVVSEVYEHPMMGNTVVITHEGGGESIYQNLADDIAVSVGEIVKSGEIIGAVGESAIIEIAEEPHLHFELKVNGEYVDPLDHISVETMTVVYSE